MLQSLAAYLYDYLDANVFHASELFYEQKAIQALGVYLGMGFTLPGARDPGKVKVWVDLYHALLRTPTWHFGEQIWRVGPTTWVDRIDMPHVWSGVYVYLDAISLTRPSFTPYRPWE